jgi:ribonuclease P protein component
MVMWLRRGEDADLRLGVVVSRRTFRRAVDRNRAKRLLREAFRLNRGRLQGRVDVVLVGRQAILSETFGTIENDLMRLASKARLTAAGVQETQGGAREPSRRQPR